MTIDRRVSLLALTAAASVIVGGCSKTSPKNWQKVVDANPVSVRDPTGPQYDPGSIDLVGDSYADLGNLYIWPNQSSTAWIEGFEIENMGNYATQKVKVVELYDTVQRGADTDFRVHEFDGLVDTNVCKISDSVCMAKREFAFVAFPGSLSAHVGWEQKVVAVEQFVDTNCDSSVNNLGRSGFVYRDRITMQQTGQVRWVEYWFVRKTALSPFAKYEGPDMCQNQSSNDYMYYIELPVPLNAPSTTDGFLKQLKGIDCGSTPPPWCGFCTANGSACDYTPLILDWYRRK